MSFVALPEVVVSGVVVVSVGVVTDVVDSVVTGHNRKTHILVHANMVSSVFVRNYTL